MNVHPDEFGGTDDGSHYCSQTVAHRPFALGQLDVPPAQGHGRLWVNEAADASPVRFTAANDEDAKRIAAVLGALGFKPQHVATMPVGFRISKLAEAYHLTTTEVIVLARFVDGVSLDKIAAAIDVLAVATVELHMRSIHHKTGTANEVELLRLVARS